MVKKIYIKDSIPNIDENVSCIGYFDGVHIGHQKLIKETVKRANKLNLVPTLICFKPDPLEVITGKKQKHILSFSNQFKTIEYFGIKQIIIINFNEELMKMTPSQFIKNYLNRLNMKQLICGYDFTYGYKGKGDIACLKKYGKFESFVVDRKDYKGEKVSSTRIKQSLSKGNIKLVNKLLGYDYYIEVKVEKSSKKANKWLIEAKKKDSSVLLPCNGEYSDSISIDGNAISFLGPKKLNKGQTVLLNLLYE